VEAAGLVGTDEGARVGAAFVGSAGDVAPFSWRRAACPVVPPIFSVIVGEAKLDTPSVVILAGVQGRSNVVATSTERMPGMVAALTTPSSRKLIAGQPGAACSGPRRPETGQHP
jgi:hypothetical protein